MDYANRLTTYNIAQAHRDADGIYRFVISAEDPGTFNWLDTTGLERGVVIVRFVRAVAAVSPTARVVELSAVAEELPATRRCTPDERRDQISERRDGVAHMLLD